jgi:hypothetical protein
MEAYVGQDVEQDTKYGDPRFGNVVELPLPTAPTTSKFYGRVRVLWFNPNGTVDKRTWVAEKTLRPRTVFGGS